MTTTYEVSREATGEVGTARARILFATDPICSHCWAMEPAWRRFLYHYGEHVEATHLYGGLLPQWEGFADVGAGIRAPEDIPPHWEEVAERYGQPIDPSVWLTDPLHSSYPPSIAVHAVRALAPGREEDYLRRIRQALFLEARVQRHPLLRSWETSSFTHPVLQFCCDFTSFPAGEGLPACCRSSPSSSRSR